jgi:hypothetical protein
MKLHPALAITLLLPTLSLGIACQTSGNQKADSTAMHMDELRSAVNSMKEKVTAAATSLAEVVQKGETDPKPAFDKYKKDVEAVVSGFSRTESNLKSMRAEGQSYFAEWEKQAATITDPDLKKSAEERRARLQKAVEAVSSAMEAAGAEIKPYMASIKDVQTYLSNDLTPSGVESVEGKSKQIRKDADSICEKLDDVVEAVEKGAPEFKTAKPPPPPPKT